jgi:hypothetical protein
MKKLILCLGCFLLIAALAPCLHAEQLPAPTAQADLTTQIFAPASSTAAVSPADPAKAAPADLFPPAPKLASCTYKECISGCDDCPWGHVNYCISTVSCICGCR